jgi:hypothetical protein
MSQLLGVCHQNSNQDKTSRGALCVEICNFNRELGVLNDGHLLWEVQAVSICRVCHHLI